MLELRAIVGVMDLCGELMALEDISKIHKMTRGPDGVVSLISCSLSHSNTCGSSRLWSCHDRNVRVLS